MSKFLLYPVYFKPKLNSSDTFKFLDNIDCILLAYVDLTSNEKKEFRTKSSREITFFDKLISVQSEYKIITYSTAEKKYRMFSVEIFQYCIPLYFGKRHLEYIEEKDSNILNKFSEKYDINTIIVDDECPACNNPINNEDLRCKSCGLSFI